MGAFEELVVLVDDDGTPVGTWPKATVHNLATPLHLAFSAHISAPDGAILLTRRALQKATWPGVWTNACCGHPLPGEPPEDAVRRRARDELGLELGELRLVLPDFRYRAVDAAGVVEHELCPVYETTALGIPRPDPAEVAELAWVRPEDLAASVTATPFAFSPWLVQQLDELAMHGAGPLARV